MKLDKDFLTVNQVLAKLKEALEQNKRLSIVRVGDGENLILAQNSVMPVEDVLTEKWVLAANRGEKGVMLPNLRLRDEMVNALHKADIVGIPFWNKDPIIAEDRLKRPLTEQVFNHFQILPNQICHTFVNRALAQKRDFWQVLKGRRIFLMSSWAAMVKSILEQAPYELHIAHVYSFTNYEQMEEALNIAAAKKDEYDIALVSCGVNAVVLAQRMAEITGKVAFDFGKSLMFIVNKKAGLEHSSNQAYEDMLP